MNGLVTRVNVRHHPTVKKGELLFPLDDGDSSAKTPTQISRTSNSNG
nr:biotin/lipoyl-binding protein [Edwardsiella hoshinae]